MHISILEDEDELSQQLASLLESQGHSVSLFTDGLQLLRAIRDDIFDLYVLDWHVPGASGLEVLQHIRTIKKIEKPIIFMTSNANESDIVSVLNMGADDYCIKPLKPAEFNARLGALMRRAYPKKLNDFIRDFWGYQFNTFNQTVTFNNTQVNLNDKEFKLALCLFENAEGPISRQRLINEVWLGTGDSLSRSLDVHISWLRRKLNLSPSSGQLHLRAIHGFGYRLVVTPQSPFFEKPMATP